MANFDCLALPRGVHTPEMVPTTSERNMEQKSAHYLFNTIITFKWKYIFV